jgi:selenide,water dikinase
MGGKPLTALNLVMFPSKHLDMGVLREILRGGHDKVHEAGASLVGGHSVDDNEPKYGLCVNGVVHPDKILTNAGARPGDALVLTKPLGSGVLFNAVRAGKFSYSDLEKESLPIIAGLNGIAMEKALNYQVHSCTDVTGFGILGHGLEMANGSGTRLVIDHSALNYYPGAAEMYRKGETTGSNKPNREMVARFDFSLQKQLPAKAEELLYDPQTSGGLLISLPAAEAVDLVADLKSSGNEYVSVIGEVTDGSPGLTVR